MNKSISNILKGVGSTLELLPPEADEIADIRLPERSDSGACGEDWQAVFDHLYEAMQAYSLKKKELPNAKTNPADR